MKIPIHVLLDQLGIKDLELKTPEEIEAVKQQLDDLIVKYEKSSQEADA